MGYMGFGMRKEVYTRKPKTSFSKIKEVYGDHMENYAIKNKTSTWTEKEKEEFKSFVRDKIKKERQQEQLYNALIFFIILFIVGFAIYLAGGVL